MLNMDFDRRHAIETQREPWQVSPSSKVWRKPLEREAKESGHTTSVVKYAAGASFAAHSHPLGEEIFVLDGVFSDEYGDYPAGTYIRNPPGSKHRPFSHQGCVILVKLNQFDKRDLNTIRVNTHTAQWLPGQGGRQVMPLHQFEDEHVTLVRWPANENLQSHSPVGGQEVFVLSGIVNNEHGSYPVGTWIRSPHTIQHQPCTHEETIIWVKTGHIAKTR